MYSKDLIATRVSARNKIQQALSENSSAIAIGGQQQETRNAKRQ